MNYSDNNNIKLDILKKKAYSLHWAEVADGTIPLIAVDMDYLCAPAIKQALLAYVEEGYLSYTPKLGLPTFNQVFLSYMEEAKGEKTKTEQVLAVDSAARAIFIMVKAFLKPGDEMIIFDPCDFLFRESCLAAEATPINYAAKLDTENRKTDLSKLEECINERTKMIGLYNPYNPYGLVYTKEELEVVM